MKCIKLVKKETIKTSWRKLKKRKFRTVTVSLLSSSAQLFYINSNTFSLFMRTQKFGNYTSFFSQLLNEEIGILILLQYWVKQHNFMFY